MGKLNKNSFYSEAHALNTISQQLHHMGGACCLHDTGVQKLTLNMLCPFLTSPGEGRPQHYITNQQLEPGTNQWVNNQPHSLADTNQWVNNQQQEVGTHKDIKQWRTILLHMRQYTVSLALPNNHLLLTLTLKSCVESKNSLHCPTLRVNGFCTLEDFNTSTDMSTLPIS